MGLFDIFKKKEQSKTLLDKVQSFGGPLIVNGFRKIASLNNIAPTSKTSDQKILEIYQKVGTAFKVASKQRGEHLLAGQINSIVLKFFQVYEMTGEEMFQEHLNYEVEKYIQEGLRADYRQELKIF